MWEENRKKVLEKGEEPEGIVLKAEHLDAGKKKVQDSKRRSAGERLTTHQWQKPIRVGASSLKFLRVQMNRENGEKTSREMKSIVLILRNEIPQERVQGSSLR